MGGCQRDISIYERYSSATVDAVHCPCSDGVAMMVSDGGDGLFRWCQNGRRDFQLPSSPHGLAARRWPPVATPGPVDARLGL